jgi:cell division protein FtsB
LLTAVEQGNRQRSATEQENQSLRQQVKTLDAKIASLEADQRAAAEASRILPKAPPEASSGIKKP